MTNSTDDHTLSVLWELVHGVKISEAGIEEVFSIPEKARFKIALSQGREILKRASDSSTRTDSKT